MRKKLIVSVLVTALACSMITGCSNTEKTDNNNEKKALEEIHGVFLVPQQSQTLTSTPYCSSLAVSPPPLASMPAQTMTRAFRKHVVGPKDFNKLYNSGTLGWKIQLILKHKMILFSMKQQGPPLFFLAAPCDL